MSVAAQRTRELAAIHAGKRQLGLDDTTYRDMLWTVGRVRSAKDLDHAGRQAVIEHMRRCGFARVPGHEARGPHGAKPQVSPDRQPLVNKLEALLASRALPWNYALAMSMRMFKIDRLEWATAEQLRKLVGVLEIDRCRRAGRL